MLIRAASVLLLLLTCSQSVHAGLVIRGSRIIYEEARGEVTVQMQYVGDSPALLQMWLEPDDSHSAPGEQEVPFIITPAVTRVDPGNGQTVRILRTGDGLPQDCESVLYFNTLEVPPAPTAQIAAGEAFMQFSIRGSFKFFYRPKGLTAHPGQAPTQLQFSLAGPLPDGRLQLRVNNASPYHVTFSALSVHRGGERKAAQQDDPIAAMSALLETALVRFSHDSPGERMVAPFGELLLPLDWGTLPAGSGLPAGIEVGYSIINDAGGVQVYQRPVNG